MHVDVVEHIKKIKPIVDPVNLCTDYLIALFFQFSQQIDRCERSMTVFADEYLSLEDFQTITLNSVAAQEIILSELQYRENEVLIYD